jgi:hypothetical protein
MRSYKTFLESRRNPHLNYKIAVRDELRKYSNDPNIFIHYSNDIVHTDLKDYEQKIPNPHVRMNLRYGYHITPMGLYSYPLKLVYNKLESDSFFDFGTNRMSIFVLRNLSSKVLYTSLYSEDDCKRDLKILGKNIYTGDYDPRDKFNTLWNVTKDFFAFKSKEWRKIFLELGYECIVDDNGYEITGDIKYQAIFFTNKWKVVDLLRNINAGNKDIVLHKVNDFIEEAISMRIDFESTFTSGFVLSASSKYTTIHSSLKTLDEWSDEDLLKLVKAIKSSGKKIFTTTFYNELIENPPKWLYQDQELYGFIINQAIG